MCTRLYSLKLGETVPTDICMPSAAWCWGQSTATQRSTIDQTHQQTSQGVTDNHGDQPSSPQGAPRDASESRARSRRAQARDLARDSEASLGAPWGLLGWSPWLFVTPWDVC